jgi:Flp pilus assembly protein TadB
MQLGQRGEHLPEQPRLVLWAVLFAAGLLLLLTARPRPLLAERLARLDLDARARQDDAARVAGLLVRERLGLNPWWLLRALVGELFGPALLDAWGVAVRCAEPFLPELARGVGQYERLVLVYPDRGREEALWQHLGGKVILAGLLGGLVPGAAALAGVEVPLAAWLVGALVGFVAPDLVVQRLLAQRAEQVLEELPAMCDQLVLCLSAPQNLVQALHIVALRGAGVVADELRLVVGRMEAGESLPEALAAMDRRNGIPELTSLGVVLVAADAEGMEPAALLADFADDLRSQLRMRLLEASGRALATMGLPITLAAMPAVAVIVLVPAFVQLLQLYGH